MSELTKNDLKIGRFYSAKQPQRFGFFRLLNDREIIWLSDTHVKYDSPSVKFGAKYPIVTIERFLKWVKEDVTEQMPKDEWRRAG
ncbi:hypothetical protein [Haemophilus influenzae]|uniref:hypothetical protein n=1 Tax=Haemophilus influenzae TaxID=727 RepID=UPI000D0076AA|nr:hypothetical protein [Haemophilus influenzae]MCK8835018.1 hypothetical protein [Haemophilus influenzae]MCK8835899.1 hypothetical protein [Haemophilus influenzae]PRI67712.1 hypothetical protein BVZ90_00100 [Haemophilus influenzae]PRI70458.1 hypothetical protein BVZ92_00547 [Haemophilus influenzae]PRI78078.1 hypothetical protein BV001_00802 [Haemophilus influenzae]